MRGPPGEDEIGARVGERRCHHHFPETVRMPGDGDVGVGKGARTHHEGFRGAAFLGGAAIVTHATRRLVRRQPILHRGGGKQRGRTQQIVAATVAVASRLQRARLCHTGFLTKTGQRVIFAEESDDRTALAPFADQGGGNAGDILRDAETLMAQFGEMFGSRACLGIANFGHGPDPVGQGDETRLDRVNAEPDVAAVVHARLPDRCENKICISFAGPRLAAAGRPAMRPARVGCRDDATRLDSHHLLLVKCLMGRHAASHEAQARP